jgi:hypothetical protein
MNDSNWTRGSIELPTCQQWNVSGRRMHGCISIRRPSWLDLSENRPQPGWEEAGRHRRGQGGDRAAQSALLEGLQLGSEEPAHPAGQVQVDFTIAPSGKVTAVRMSPPDFGGAEFAQRLEGACLTLDFGLKNVAEQNVRFPIDCLPQ